MTAKERFRIEVDEETYRRHFEEKRMREEIDVLFLLMTGTHVGQKQTKKIDLLTYDRITEGCGFYGVGIYQRLKELEERVAVIDGKKATIPMSRWNAISTGVKQG